mmetsp:Transcript_29856/g.27341  ORF Transcript_29856/g.27341 Transcript_29856/m.27341 type:complete len:319 (+) Transcript_29856:68-1024(+)
MSKKQPALIIIIISALIMTSFGHLLKKSSQTTKVERILDEDEKLCPQEECFERSIYICKEAGKDGNECTCPCLFVEDNSGNLVFMGLFGFFAFVASFLLIYAYFKKKAVREYPGDLILGLAIADFLTAIQLLTSGFAGLAKDYKLNPNDSTCKAISVFTILGTDLQILYNIMFFFFFIFEMKKTLKKSRMPHFMYHVIPIVVAIISMILQASYGLIGMSVTGICSQRTIRSVPLILIITIIFLILPIYTLFYIRRKVPKSKKIGLDIRHFLEYYDIYVIAVIITFVSLAIATGLLHKGVDEFFNDSNKTGLIEVANWI